MLNDLKISDMETYSSPSVNVVDIESEGVLCGSVDIQDWERDDEILDF